MGDRFIGSGHNTARTNESVNGPALSTKVWLATFVEQAGAHARLFGQEAALSVFNNRTGPFASGDVYVESLDYNGTALALPFQPDKVGTRFFGTRDSTGLFYPRAEIEPRPRGRRVRLLRLPESGTRQGDRAKDELTSGTWTRATGSGPEPISPWWPRTRYARGRSLQAARKRGRSQSAVSQSYRTAAATAPTTGPMM